MIAQDPGGDWLYDLVWLAQQQLARHPAEGIGLALQPVDQSASRSFQFLKHLAASTGSETALSQATVVSRDLDVVALNLESVPIDEVLAFREEHGTAYRAYARDLREFVRDASLLNEQAREQALADREEELIDTARDLSELSRKAWRRPMASFSLGIAGASVALVGGDLAGAALAAGGGLLGLKRTVYPGTAYAYIYETKTELGR
jgi:hypothetical protein